MAVAVDETGKRYGRLTVLERSHVRDYRRAATWLCACDCGGYKSVAGITLRQGLVTSCGCLLEAKKRVVCGCGYVGPRGKKDWQCFRCRRKG